MQDYSRLPYDSTPTRRGDNGTFAMTKNHWSTLGQVTSILQILLGFVLFLASTLFLVHSSKLSGQFIGVLSALLGVLGIMGMRLKETSLQTLFIVGMGFMAMMTFEFTVQVGRDLETHCTMAETYSRIVHLEDKILALKHDDMMTQLFLRLNEVDDMLDMVQEGTIDRIEARYRGDDISFADEKYIASKIEMLKRHAEHVLDALVDQGNEATEEEKKTKDPKVIQKQKEIKQQIQKHLENVEEILNTIEDKEDKDEQLTFDEYARLLTALLGSQPQSDVLQDEHDELGSVKEAFSRRSIEAPEEDTPLIKEIREHREEQRKLFEDKFQETYDVHGKLNPTEFDASLQLSLDDLPEHCMMETTRFDYFFYSGWLLIISQMTAAYMAATSLFVTCLKKDF